MKKLFLYASLLCISLVSCKKEYLVPEGELPSWLGESIYKELQQSSQLEGTFKTYCRLIDDLGYAEVLGKTGSKTIFPANDEAFERFFKGGNNKFGASSYDELTYSQKAELLFSTMIDNAILVGALSNSQNNTGAVLQGQLVKHATNMRTSYAVTPLAVQNMPANNPYFSRFEKEGRNSILAVYDNTVAPMVHLTGEYMLNNNMTVTGDDNDFKILTGSDYEDGAAYVFDRKIIKSDVVCQNGYIHQLDEVLVNPGNMAEMLRSISDTRYFSRMLDYYSFPQADLTLTTQYNETAGTSQDTVFAIRYLSNNSQRSKLNMAIRGITVADNRLLKFDPGWNFYNPDTEGNVDNEAEIAAILAPNDKAVEDYFWGEGAYILKNLGVQVPDIKTVSLNDHLDAIYNNDPSIFASILNNVMQQYLTKTVPSTFSTVQNDAFEFLDVTKEDLVRKSDGNYDVTIANNGVIYKMNKLFGPKLYNSVLGPASVYKDMRVMGEMLNDHQTKAGTPSKLGADMYYYLLSMKARYGLFVPTDNETQFIVIDPTSVKDEDGHLKGLRFRFDPQTDGSFHVKVKKYIYQSGPYNKLDSYIEDTQTDEENIEEGHYNSQIKDLLDYCTIVLADSTETGKGNAKYGLYGNRFYKTKHGGVVVVDKDEKKVAGGLQLSNPAYWSNITETFDANSADAKIENGTVYRLDFPIQPTITSVMKTLERSEFYDGNADYTVDAPEYDHFLNFCLQFNNDDIYSFAGIITGNEKNQQQVATKLKAYRVIDDNDNWGMLSSYNYTIYAPTYEAMVQAQQNMGLPTWKKVLAIVNDWESVKDQYGFTSKSDASAYVKKQLDKMAKFVRYHTQNNSLFADYVFKNYDLNTGKTEPEPSFSTFCSNALGIAQTLTVTGGNYQLNVTDATNKTVTINASSDTANMIARDITVAEDGKYKSIETSAFVTIHGITTPLCFNSSGSY